MPGGDFPKSSGIAGQAAEPHPGTADHGGHSVGAADPGLRTRSGALGPALVAAPGRRGCDRESQRPVGRTGRSKSGWRSPGFNWPLAASQPASIESGPDHGDKMPHKSLPHHLPRSVVF
jgi:hypothetical protein